jgi:hypothetical protein
MVPTAAQQARPGASDDTSINWQVCDTPGGFLLAGTFSIRLESMSQRLNVLQLMAREGHVVRIIHVD